ncbi:MAG: hypothetical protein EBX35_12895, partial [Planctomycetia bacterium]|nr:hypothetical protein [Planctomycetia bacterium]
TTTLDGQPRSATGRFTVRRLVQPPTVVRADLLGHSSVHPRRPGRGRGGIPAPAPPNEPDLANPETWEEGEEAFSAAVTTEAATGRSVATAHLVAGIYRATFEIPAVGDVPAVKAVRLVEVVDPAAERYGVKRPLALRAERETVAAGETYRAVVGTGYDAGRAMVEISQSGVVLDRFWTAAGRTQWPLSFAAGEANRGGFTVRVWLVRDGRLHVESRTVDVPWTDKRLAVEWERFTRRTQPGQKEVWRAKVTTVADDPAGPVAPAAAEFLALLFDESLEALAPHAWPGVGLTGILRRESGWVNVAFTNGAVALQHVQGSFREPHRDVAEMTYRALREPFGSPSGWRGFLGGFGGMGGMARRGRVLMAPMAAAAAPADAVAADVALGGVAGSLRKQADQADKESLAERRDGGNGDGAPRTAAATSPPPRKNLVETAFFLPTLSSDPDGVVTIEFTLPDTLTTWRFRGLAHDARLRSGTLEDTCIAAKDLMVEPLVPRFLREGDLMRIPVKVSNASTGRLSGTVRFALSDARTDEDRGALIEGEHVQPFDLAAGESRPVVFTVRVADGTDVLKYLATGSAGRAADGEEAYLPVLPRRVPVTETVPVTIRGPGERRVSLERLAASAGTDIKSESLVVQAVSNPAWYAVLALPSIMEQADESTETLFTRLYANTLARHLATSDPRIA